MLSSSSSEAPTWCRPWLEDPRDVALERLPGAGHAPRGLAWRPRAAVLPPAAGQRVGDVCRRRGARARCRGGGGRRAAAELCTVRRQRRPSGWRPGRTRHRPRRPGRDVHRQPARVHHRTAGATAAGRDCGAGGRARAAAGAGLHRASMRRRSHRHRRFAGRPAARCRRSPGAAPAHQRRPCAGLHRTGRAAGWRPRAAAAARVRRGRGRCDPLHLGHHRQPQGSDADASQHRAFGAALPGLHGAEGGRPGGAGRARQPCHGADRGDPVAAACRRHSGGGAGLQGRQLHRAARRRRHHAHDDGAGDVQPVPAAPQLRAGQAGTLAHRRLRWRADAGGDHRRARCPPAGTGADQRLRRHRDHLAGHHDADGPDARPCRHRGRAAAGGRPARDGRRRP